MVQLYLQLVISGESKLDVSSLKRLKTEVEVLQWCKLLKVELWLLLAGFEEVDC